MALQVLTMLLQKRETKEWKKQLLQPTVVRDKQAIPSHQSFLCWQDVSISLNGKGKFQSSIT